MSLSRKKIQKTQKKRKTPVEKSLLQHFEALTSKKPPEIYYKMGWSRQRYHFLRYDGAMIPLKHLERLRLAFQLGPFEFYETLREYLTSKTIDDLSPNYIYDDEN